MNPGGPGGSAVDYARAAPNIFGDVILDSFNVVGLDPRGVGLSEPIQCFTDEKIDELNSEPFASVKTLSNTDLELEYAELGNLCETNGGELLNHMSTIESAQDLDIARAAVGDDVLNYLGKSYGTAIGAAYIRLFPNTIGRVVLDGVLPIDIDAAEVTRTQAEAFEVATAHFIADCVTRDDCPFSPEPSVAVQELRDLFTSLDRAPVITTDPNRPLNGALLSRAVLSYLYFPEMDYPRLRAALAEVVNNQDGTAALALADERTNRGPEGEYLNNSTDAYFGVTCLDLPYQGSVQDARAFSAELAVIAPTFGEQLGLGVLACRNWPAVGPSLPPLPQSINAPILIANPANDPATPLLWAQRLNEQLPDSRLVVWNTHHHTAYTNGSRCVDEIVETYLLTGDAPTFAECSA